jgi:hypothetical protein
MSYTADPKDPAESAIFSLDIVDDLAADGSETISSVTADISVREGVDPSAGQMLYGPAGVSGTEISQRVKGGIDGNWYAVKFTVITTLQTLAYTLLIPVTEGG